MSQTGHSRISPVPGSVTHFTFGLATGVLEPAHCKVERLSLSPSSARYRRGAVASPIAPTRSFGPVAVIYGKTSSFRPTNDVSRRT